MLRVKHKLQHLQADIHQIISVQLRHHVKVGFRRSHGVVRIPVFHLRKKLLLQIHGIGLLVGTADGQIVHMGHAAACHDQRVCRLLVSLPCLVERRDGADTDAEADLRPLFQLPHKLPRFLDQGDPLLVRHLCLLAGHQPRQLVRHGHPQNDPGISLL